MLDNVRSPSTLGYETCYLKMDRLQRELLPVTRSVKVKIVPTMMILGLFLRTFHDLHIVMVLIL